ncbi:MAG: hypothetical protein H6716_25315 [Polyangiaceae bacterium]|nr:hypothetical protein [Polyangiaceae bacterium]
MLKSKLRGVVTPLAMVAICASTQACGEDASPNGGGGSSGAATGGVAGATTGGIGAGGTGANGGSAGSDTGGASGGGAGGIGPAGAGGAAGAAGASGAAGAGGVAGTGGAAGTGGVAGAGGAAGAGGTGGSACAVLPGVTPGATDWELAATDPGIEGATKPELVDFDADACGVPYLTYRLNGLGLFVSRWGSNGFEMLGDRNANYPFTDAETAVLDLAKDGHPVIAWQKSGSVGAATWDGTSWQALGSSVGTGTLRAIVALDAGPMVLTSEGNYENKTVRARGWSGSAWQEFGTQPIIGPIIDVYLAATKDSRGRVVVTYSQPAYSGGRQMSEYAIRWDGSSWIPLGGAHGSEWYQPGEVDQVDVVAGAGDSPIASDGLTGATRWNGVDWESYPDLPRGPFAFATDPDGVPLIAKQGKFPSTSTVGQLKVVRLEAGAWTQLGSLIADDILANNYNSNAYPYIKGLKIGSGEKARWVALQTATALSIQTWGR